jgi:hypothetical protein
MGKNGPPGWTSEAQAAAGEIQAPVHFGVGDEEYGTYVALPGLGCYSHVVDLIAPAGRDFGKPVPKRNHPYPWPEFRDGRLAALHKGAGRLIWQVNDNEEFSRVLLDEAVEKGTYAGISTFHFGKQNFVQTYPFLHRWYERLPFVALHDAHSRESWWWGNQLAGYRTLFIAKDPSWESWLEALEKRWVMAVRHDDITNWKTQFVGGSPTVRDHVTKLADKWKWWNAAGKQVRRPAAALTLLRPGMKFETGAPSAEGRLALRVRLWHDNSQQGQPLTPRAELVTLSVDGQRVEPSLQQGKDDRYFLYEFPSQPGSHRAEAIVKVLDSRRTVTIATAWRV